MRPSYKEYNITQQPLNEDHTHLTYNKKEEEWIHPSELKRIHPRDRRRGPTIPQINFGMTEPGNHQMTIIAVRLPPIFSQISRILEYYSTDFRKY